MTMSAGPGSSVAFGGSTAAPAIGLSSQRNAGSAGHRSGDTIVVSVGAQVASQQSDAGNEQATAEEMRGTKSGNLEKGAGPVL